MVVVTGGVDKLIGVLAGAFLIGESNAATCLLNDPVAREVLAAGLS